MIQCIIVFVVGGERRERESRLAWCDHIRSHRYNVLLLFQKVGSKTQTFTDNLEFIFLTTKY